MCFGEQLLRFLNQIQILEYVNLMSYNWNTADFGIHNTVYTSLGVPCKYT